MSYPHLPVLEKSGVKVDDLPAYLRKKVKSFDGYKIEMDNWDGDEVGLEKLKDAMTDLSNSMVSDLENEYDIDNDFMDITKISFPHKRAMEEYSMDKSDLSEAIQKELTNFDSIYGYVSTQKFKTTEEQDKEIKKAKQLSKALKIQIEEVMEEDRKKGIQAEKENSKTKKLNADITELVLKNEFDKALAKVEELKEINPDTEWPAKIEKAKAEFYTQKMKDMPAEKFIDELFKGGTKEISEEDMKKCGIKWKEPFWGLVSPDVEVGEYVLKQQASGFAMRNIFLLKDEPKKEEKETEEKEGAAEKEKADA